MRRTIYLLLSMAMTVGLLATASVSAVSARPKCDGKVATIVGTNGPDRIRGTSGPDVIVAKGGKDTINGRGGRDRICGGKGKDIVNGGRGNDRLFGGSKFDIIDGGRGHDDIFGFKGDDLIYGRKGNDFINGGAGIDGCYQGPGSGPIKKCEVADFEVDVSGPANAGVGDVKFTVKVTNNGPDAAPFSLFVDADDTGATCEAGDQEGEHPQPALAAGAMRSDDFILDCTFVGDDPEAAVWLDAAVSTDARDPDVRNDDDRHTTDLDS
jgi:hypothetical protein